MKTMPNPQQAYESLKDILQFQLLCGKIRYFIDRCEGDEELQQKLKSEIRPLVQALLNSGFTADAICDAWCRFEDLDE